MEKKKIIWLGVIAGVYALVTRVRWVINNLSWRFAGLAIIASNNETNSCTVDLRLQLRNISSLSVRLNSIVGDIYMQGVKVGEISQAYNQIITKRSISVVDIVFELYWKGVAEAVKANILSGDIRNLNFQFMGYLEAEGRKIRIDKVITYQELVG